MSNESDAAGEMLAAFPDVLADPGEDKMDAYEWHDGNSTWKLTDQARAFRDQCIAEQNALRISYDAQLATAKAEGEKLNARLAELNRDAALRRALTGGGCDLKLLAGAAAHLQSEWQFTADESGQVVAVVAGLQRDLGEAVNAWLGDEESGGAFRAVPRNTLGPFASRIVRT